MAAFVSRYASAFADVVTAAKLDTAAIDQQLTDFLATWNGSPELREFFENPAVAVNAESGHSRQAQREARHAEGIAQPDRRADLEQPHRPRERSGRRPIAGCCRSRWEFVPAEIVTARELDAKEREALLAESRQTGRRQS